MKFLFFILVGAFIVNPRIAFKDERPIHMISCSTGWSLHWKGLTDGSGLLGLYSPENAAWSEISVSRNSKDKVADEIKKARVSLMQICG